jgi:hypothetical protein
MPAVSKKQQQYMGMVHACQKYGRCPSAAVKKTAATIKPHHAEEFAKTRHSGLPTKKKDMFDEGYSFKQWLENKYNVK